MRVRGDHISDHTSESLEGDPDEQQPHAERRAADRHLRRRKGRKYTEDEQYRVNCQSAVVANEMRRRGWDVEAYGNTWAVNITPNALSRMTAAAWLDADGNIAKNTVISRKVTLGEKTIDRRGNVRVKKTYESDRDLAVRIQDSMREEGRYTIAWRWSGKSTGHIITAERLADGSLRFYDPQTGKIGWTAKFKDIDTTKGFKILRVDNLQPNVDVIRGVIKPSGSKAATPLMDEAQKAWWKKHGMGSDVVQGEDKELWFKSHKTDKWEHTYISKNGGCVVTELERLKESMASKNEQAKFEKELNMCKVLADNGKRVEYLRGVERPLGQTYDITIDGLKADLKCITGDAGNIVKYAAKALTKQGGEAVVFELPRHSSDYYEKLTEARRKLRGKIFFYFIDEKILREI